MKHLTYTNISNIYTYKLKIVKGTTSSADSAEVANFQQSQFAYFAKIFLVWSAEDRWVFSVIDALPSYIYIYYFASCGSVYEGRSDSFWPNLLMMDLCIST